MTNESSEENTESPGGVIKQAIDSATALTKAVPIYEDAVQPLAKETGKAFGTIGKAVNVALSPISLVVWGYDQISDFLESTVAEKLEKVPEDRISTPPPNVAGPAVEALKFTGHDKTLREMFANLIANSLDKQTVLEAHPSFVDIIKNITPDEGLILKLFSTHQNFPVVDIKLRNNKKGYFEIPYKNFTQVGAHSNCEHKQLIGNYLDNLCRLGLLEIPEDRKINDAQKYAELLNDPIIKEILKDNENNNEFEVDFEEKLIETTGMGRQFINACIIDKRLKA